MSELRAPYPIHEVDPARAEGPETGGSKRKFWFRPDESDVRWLFKYSRPHAPSASDSAVEYTGEHWAEKIAAEFADALAIPHAVVELAEERDTGAPGAIVRDLTASAAHGVIVHGNELLIELDPQYPMAQQYRASKHTLENVLQSLSRPSIGVPIKFDLPQAVHTPTDVFVGYLLLDALIGNTDRHHENWALIRSLQDILVLAPSYDHASSMGRELTDAARLKYLTTRDRRANLEAYAQKAHSALYGDERDRKPLSTRKAFAEAAKRYAKAAHEWCFRLHDLSEEMMEATVARVPEQVMSETAKRFVIDFLRYNRQWILDLDLAR